MNERLTELRIRATCRELLATSRHTTGRALRRELRKRYGAVGKTARVFHIWREEAATAVPATPAVVTAPVPTSPSTSNGAARQPPDLVEMQERLKAAEQLAADHLERAELAEYRERAHQDHWAMQVDRLRHQLRSQPDYAAEIRNLQTQVLRLTAELNAARLLLGQQP